MQTLPLIAGEADDTVINLNVSDLTKHIFILSGENTYYPRTIITKALITQLTSGGGLIYIQVTKDHTKDELIKALKAHGRYDDYMEITERHHTKLSDLIRTSMSENKILYIETSKTTGTFQRKLMRALLESSELLYHENALNSQNKTHYMIAVTQIDRILHNEWRKVCLFARRNNISIVTLIDHINDIQQIYEIKEPSITLDHIIENSHLKFIFAHNEPQDNESINQMFYLPINRFEQGLKGWYQRKVQKPSLLDELSNKQFIYLDHEELYVLDVVE